MAVNNTAAFDDAGARIICRGPHPGHSTVAEFVRRSTGAVPALLPEPVKARAAEGPVPLDAVAADGTKLKAVKNLSGSAASSSSSASGGAPLGIAPGRTQAPFYPPRT